jgi:class 3 adenylate cyclase
LNAPAPSGVVTFLFTDIEGSTRRWEADAEAMRAALETHNQVLRDAVKSHDGHVFNYTGDGMCSIRFSAFGCRYRNRSAAVAGVASPDGNRHRRG